MVNRKIIGKSILFRMLYYSLIKYKNIGESEGITETKKQVFSYLREILI